MLQKTPRPRSCSEFDRVMGPRLRAARMEAGMTQELLGDKLGLTFQQVQKYEKGMNRMCGERIAQVAAILHKPILYFYGEDAPVSPERAGHDALFVAGHSPITYRLYAAVCRLARDGGYDQITALANIAEQLSPPPPAMPAVEAAE